MLFFIFLAALQAQFVSGIQVTSLVQTELLKARCENECIFYETTNCGCLKPPRLPNLNWDIKEFNPLDVPLFLCREENKLVFRTNTQNLSYVLELRQKKTKWNLTNTFSHSNDHTITGLLSDTEYKVRFWATSLQEFYGPTETNWIRTLPLDNVPKPISNVHLSNFTLKNDDYSISVYWDTSQDSSCNYEFVWFDSNEISDYTQKEIRNTKDLFKLVINNLIFGSNYSIALTTKSSDWNKESAKFWVYFTTPTCLDVYDSLTNCVPESPIGLDANETPDGETFNVLVNWNRPRLEPIYYSIELLAFREFENETSKYQFNVSGDCSVKEICGIKFTQTASNLQEIEIK